MSAERRAIEAGRRLDYELAGRRTTETLADPYMVGWARVLALETSGARLEFGIVVDAVPGAHCYRVAAGPRSYVYCSLGGSDAAFGAAGVKPTATVPLLSRVYFARHPERPEIGTIVSVEPHWSVHTGGQPADSIWPFTRTGVAVEAAHRFPFEAAASLAATGDFNGESVEGADLSAGRPFDATAVGEWGRMTETGLSLHLDPFSIAVRVDEATGVFGFYEDQLLRVAGVNYQFVTSLVELEHLDDEGELYGASRGCLYPWEAYGLWRYNQVTPGWAAASVPNNGLAGGQGEGLTDPFLSAAGSGFAPREPEAPGQLSAARFYAYTGYLGQGGHTFIAAPVQVPWAYPDVPVGALTAAVGFVTPTGAPSGRLTVNGDPGPRTQPYAVPPNSYDGPDQPGLLDEVRSVTGGYALRSARRIVFAKRPSIPVPRPRAQPPDPAGDNTGTGYAPSGLAGNTAPHRVTADPVGTTDPNRRACLLPDALAYLFNWEGLHPFAYHANDWAVAQEGAAGSTLVNQTPPNYATLASLDALAAPPAVYLDTDHRYGAAPVYPNESALALQDDGSIVIRDAWGSEIRLVGGNIELRAAGDIRLLAGRSVVAFGAYDVVLRAHNAIDLSSAHGDVRLQAEYNVMGLAGNSGCGGFVFESKAQCPAEDFSSVGQDAIASGFIVRCPNSTVDVTAADIRLALDPGAPADGRITLDAGTSRSVFARGKQIVDRVTPGGSVVQLFDTGGGSPPAANEFSADYTILGADLLVDGKAFVSGCLSVDGWVASTVHFCSSRAKALNGAVSLYTGSFLSEAIELLDRGDYLTGTFAPAFDAQTLPAPGVTGAEYSARTEAQYKTTNFVYWRSHWEAVAAGAGETFSPWVEPTVTGLVSAAVTRSYPGARWTAADTYMYQTFTFVDPASGWTAVDRDLDRAVYEAGSPAAPTAGTLDGLYPVVVAPWKP
jgi:hypothetical protein